MASCRCIAGVNIIEISCIYLQLKTSVQKVIANNERGVAITPNMMYHTEEEVKPTENTLLRR